MSKYAFNAFPKQCYKCGEVYLEDDWKLLKYVGVQKYDPGEPEDEMRNCQCKSTLAVQLNSQTP